MGPNDMERYEYLHACEEAIHTVQQRLQQALEAGDMNAIKRLMEASRLAQEEWLVAGQAMTPQKARAVMIGFATGGALAQWVHEEDQDGPPPTVLSLYNGPLSNEEYAAKQSR